MGETAWGAFLSCGALQRSELQGVQPQTRNGCGVGIVRAVLAGALRACCGQAGSPLSVLRPSLRVNTAPSKALRLLALANTKMFSWSRLIVFLSHSLSLEREILQLRERAGRKPGDTNAAASYIQNQSNWPHHCG